jgi:lipopolysaccharide/colanic/teichoic acid biosynthesis glycosyltransferase
MTFRKFAMLFKRIFDLLAASLGLFFLFPTFIVVAVLIRIDSPGPIFFRQERVGKNGKIFRIYKFRTMRKESEKEGKITVGHDARITPIGHVLRRFKIDELPQLFNVIRNEMSLVGPRPEVPQYVAYYPAELRDTVLSVPPGITDWASIEFKDENAMLGGSSDPVRRYIEEIIPIKLSYYVRYVNERSFAVDLKIIFLTLFAIAGMSRHGEKKIPQ